MYRKSSSDTISTMAKYFTYNEQEISVGDVVRIHQKIQEDAEKFRIQIFEGIVIAVNNREDNKSFVVRKIAVGGIGVERIFPLESPNIAKIEVKKKGDVRRSKLFYLRTRIGKRAMKVKAQNAEKATAVRA